MSLIIDLQCFPTIDYFKILARFKYIEIEKYENFKKSTFRNRFLIATANGVIPLTIPISGGREQKVTVTEVTIDKSRDWRTSHWRSIVSAYKKAPFYEYYSEDVRQLIFFQEERLFDFNIHILDTLCKLLNVNTSIGFTTRFVRTPDSLDLRDTIVPNGQDFQGRTWAPRYAQVFEDRIGFKPNMSILDLIFCEGPNSLNRLKEGLE